MPTGIDKQPVSAVTWVHRDTLRANDYNPNNVAPPELELLAVSICEDGWTQPIVARKEDMEIVDGFHRWFISASPDIYALTDGMVPVVFLELAGDRAHQMMSTIRHNRARGSHYVLRMADIVAYLVGDGNLSDRELQDRLGMEYEEVLRLRERGDMRKRASKETFNAGWTPSKEAKANAGTTAVSKR